MSRTACIVLLPLLTVVVSLPGCGAEVKRARVAGSVSYNGQPLETGLIEFYPIEGTGGPSTGGVIEQGRYEIRGDKGPLIGGGYKVRITSMRPTGRTSFDRDRPNEPLELLANVIPPQYNAQSKLKVTVSSDPEQNEFDFDLQSAVAGKAAQSR